MEKTMSEKELKMKIEQLEDEIRKLHFDLMIERANRINDNLKAINAIM